MAETPLQRLRRLEAEQTQAAAQDLRPGRAAAGVAGTAGAAGVGAALSKTQLLVLFLSKIKVLLLAVKLGPLLATTTSMWLSMAIYSRYYGGALAAGLVVLILVHEMGHGLAARRMGLKVGAPIFVPFFGAVIALKEQPRSTWVEAVVGLAGPAAGLASSLVCLLLGLAAPGAYWSGLFIALAHVNLNLNLFNMIPVGGLDGDRATQPIRFVHWLYGGAALLALAVLDRLGRERLQPLLLLVLVVGAVKAASSFQQERGAAQAARLVDKLAEAGRYRQESDVSDRQRAVAGAGYFLVAGALTALILVVDSLQGLPGR